jgi:hypothetical protein
MLLAARLFFPRNKKSDLIRFLNVLLYQEERNPFPKGQVKKNFFSIPSALSPGRNFLFFSRHQQIIPDTAMKQPHMSDF